MIGIIAAMNVEMESLRSHIENPVSKNISGITFVSGTLEGKEGFKVYMDKIVAELKGTMTMCGTPTLKDITADNIFIAK